MEQLREELILYLLLSLNNYINNFTNASLTKNA